MDSYIYCSNIEQLKQELKDEGFYDVETNTYTHRNLLHLKKNENGASLGFIRNNKLDLDKFPSLTDFGNKEEILANEANHTLYKSVHPYDVPEVWTDKDNVEHTRTLPFEFGAFYAGK